jgi:tetratricopeptide (TPR) repeat protein
LRRSEHEEARRRYEEALSLYRRVGDVLGEANCMRSLGDIALRRAEHEEAWGRYQEALGLYQEIPALDSVGQTHRRLARLSSNPEQRDTHLRAARVAWLSIDRADLVQELVEEFGSFE